MNKYILLSFFTLIFINCQSQNLNIKDMDTIVTPQFKKFNYKKIEDLKTNLLSDKKNISYRKDSTIDYKFTKEYKTYQLLEYDEDENVFRKTIIGEDNSVELYQKLTPFLDYYEKYFPDGKIAVKAITSWLGFGIGKQYTFTKDGKISGEKDFDEGYDFTFNDILKFCVENQINLTNECEFPNRVIKIQDNNEKKYWILEYCNSTDGKIDHVKIDAKTGEVVIKYSENFPRK